MESPNKFSSSESDLGNENDNENDNVPQEIIPYVERTTSQTSLESAPSPKIKPKSDVVDQKESEKVDGWRKEFDTLWAKMMYSKMMNTLPPRKHNLVMSEDLADSSAPPPPLASIKTWKSLSLVVPDEKPVPKVLRRANSMEWKHSWDYLAFYPDVSDWKNKKSKTKKKQKSKRNVRFTEDTVDNSKVEMNFQAFEDLLLNDKEEITKGLVYEHDDAGNDFIVAGSVEKLVSRLADSGLPDVHFIQDFLYSFRSIIGPLGLLNKLIERFNFQLPPNATQEDVDYRSKYARAIKLRVVNVLKKWLQFHYYDFLEEPRLLARLSKFLDDNAHELDQWGNQLRFIIQAEHHTALHIDVNSPTEMIEITMKREDCGLLMRQFMYKKKYYNACFWGHEFVKWVGDVIGGNPTQAFEIAQLMIDTKLVFALDEKTKELEPMKVYRFANKPIAQAPPPMAPKILPDGPSKFLDIHPLEIARQISLLTFNAFKKVNARELTRIEQSKWSPLHDSPLEFLSRQSSNIVTWIASEVVMSPNSSQRAEIVKRFIQVADYCIEFQNFSVGEAVLKGLDHPGVKRLQKTWKAVGKKLTKRFQTLKTMLLPENLLSVFQKASANPPMIPILDAYIVKMQQIFELPATLENGMIDFRRLRQIAHYIKEIETGHSIGYPFATIQHYQVFLDQEVVILDAPSIMKFSNECEPNSTDIIG